MPAVSCVNQLVLDLQLISAATGAALVGAGLVSVIAFPPVALVLLRPYNLPRA